MRETLSYPFGDRADAVLIGGGLHLLAVWIPLVPFVAVAGYLLRVLARTTDAERVRDAEVPSWRPVGPLLLDGLRAIAVTVAYLAVPVALLVVTLGGPLERIDPTGAADGVLFLVGSTVVLMLSFALTYPLPAALVALAHEGRVRAAFDRQFVGSACRDARYLFAVIVAGATLAIAAASYGPLNTVAAGFFVAFYAEVVCAALVGSAVGTAWSRRGLA